MNFIHTTFDVSWLTIVGWTLLHSVWQIATATVVFALLRWSLQSGPKAQRARQTYWLGCLTLASMAMLPILTFAYLSTSQTEPEIDEAPVSFAHLVEDLIVGSGESNFVALPLPADASVNQAPAPAFLELSSTAQADRQSSIPSLFDKTLPLLALFWPVGVALFAIRPILGLIKIHQLKAEAHRELPESLKSVAQAVVARLGLRQSIRFAVSKLVVVPTVAGYFKPVVLFPISTLTELSPQHIELVIAHELAHIRRHDYLVNLLQTILESVLFFHPCVWWVSGVVRQEREHCCDDVAIQLGSPKRYANALVSLEKSRASTSAPALSATDGNLYTRIERLIDLERRPRRRDTAWFASMVAFSIATCVLAVAQSPVHGGAPLSKTAEEEIIRQDFARTKLGKSIDLEMSKLNQVGFSGSILVAHQGKIILAKSAGFSNSKNKIANKPNSLYEIASITTSFTTTAVMMLVEEGKLDLDDSIADYLPGVPENCRQIKVRHLAQHAAGIPGNSYGITNRGLETAVRTMLGDGPKFKPGSRFEHWNQGIILLSEIVAKAAGEPYVDFVKKRIFEPCEMKGTCFTGDRKPQGYKITTGSGRLGPPRTCLEHPYGSYGLQYRGVGGIVSNVHDMWKFHSALQGNLLLKDESKAKMYDAGPIEFYALGWRVSHMPNHKTKLSNTGLVRGFTCQFHRYPESDSCIIVLSNRDSGPARTVAGVIEGILFPVASKNKLAPKEAEKYVGKYGDRAGRTIDIDLIDGRLTYTVLWQPKNPRGPVSRGYVLKDEKGNVVFRQPNDLNIIKPTFSNDGSKVVSLLYGELPFQRIGN